MLASIFLPRTRFFEKIKNLEKIVKNLLTSAKKRDKIINCIIIACTMETKYFFGIFHRNGRLPKSV